MSMLEKDTRQLLIDQRLLAAGWDVTNPAAVTVEFRVDVSAARSIREGETVAGFADYILRDRAGQPLAVVEAKRTARYALAGKEQAAEYADAIQRTIGRDPFIFLTNGVDIWF